MPFSVFSWSRFSCCFFLYWWHFCTLGKLVWNTSFTKVSGVRLPGIQPQCGSLLAVLTYLEASAFFFLSVKQGQYIHPLHKVQIQYEWKSVCPQKAFHKCYLLLIANSIWTLWICMFLNIQAHSNESVNFIFGNVSQILPICPTKEYSPKLGQCKFLFRISS